MRTPDGFSVASPRRKPRSRAAARHSRPDLVERRGNDGGTKTLALVVLASLALALAGCGKKAPPTPPPGVPNTFPQQYPPQ